MDGSTSLYWVSRWDMPALRDITLPSFSDLSTKAMIHAFLEARGARITCLDIYEFASFGEAPELSRVIRDCPLLHVLNCNLLAVLDSPPIEASSLAVLRMYVPLDGWEDRPRQYTLSDNFIRYMDVLFRSHLPALSYLRIDDTTDYHPWKYHYRNHKFQETVLGWKKQWEEKGVRLEYTSESRSG
jgi:hypothetical protein